MTIQKQNINVSSESLISVLGLVYAHYTLPTGGDLYLTRYGMRYASLLSLRNWYDSKWFKAHGQRLTGTSAVYRVPTSSDGYSLDLVVKNSRVGEDVPTDTRTFLEFINAQFNSPWEEFSLTLELREGKYGDPKINLKTQEPLAIFVPSETMQPWQSGRSVDRIKRIQAKHPGIDVDILKQYKLIYGWIHGMDLVECLCLLGLPNEIQGEYSVRCAQKSIQALEAKGFVVADMKASHIIISETHVETLKNMHASGKDKAAYLESLIDTFQYSIIDYELLTRTPKYDEVVHTTRRQIYLDNQRDRFKKTSLASYLRSSEQMGVPYVCGHTESTDGQLWVVGRNSALFDYFLPERWRRTHSWKLSKSTDIFYTVTKDHIHLVWKISRVGETPRPNADHPHAEAIIQYGYNSPFEEFAIAHDLTSKGVGTVYVRAIYRTGSTKLIPITDDSRYVSHQGLICPNGTPLLQREYNYITLRGYFNGTDDWVAAHQSTLCRSADLDKAVTLEYISPSCAEKLMENILNELHHAGYSGEFLTMDDILIAITPDNTLLLNQRGDIDARICNFEFIRRL